MATFRTKNSGLMPERVWASNLSGLAIKIFTGFFLTPGNPGTSFRFLETWAKERDRKTLFLKKALKLPGVL